MTIKMIGLDLDETLLTSEHDISPRTVQALTAANNKGILIVPVTGRPRNGLPEALKKLPFLQYCITSNGASIWQLPDFHLIAKNTLSSVNFFETAEYIESVSLISEYFFRGQGYESRQSFQNTMDLFQEPHQREYFIRSRTPVDDILSLLRSENELEEAAVQFSSKALRDSALKTLRRNLNLKISCPGECYIEITDLNAGKGVALSRLSDMLGIHPDEVMVLGDSDNDTDMFSYAGVPVAMGNASAHLKEKSCFITQDNNRDGVAIAVEQFCGL